MIHHCETVVRRACDTSRLCATTRREFLQQRHVPYPLPQFDLHPELSKDDALYNDFRAGVTKFNMLVDSVQNGEGTAGKFIKDPSLFNNVNQVTSEFQKLMYDFRQNPKKFLTVNFKLF